MNNLMRNIKKILKSISYPLIFLSAFSLLISILSLLPIDELQTVKNYFSGGINILFCICVTAFIVFYYCDNAKKAITSAFAVTMSDLFFFAVTGEHYSFLFIVFLSFVCSVLFNNIDLLYGYFALMLCAIVCALVLGLIYPYMYDLLKSFCSLIKNKPGLFGVINNVYSIAFSENFGEMFYHKSYSESILVNDNLTSGAVDIFIASEENPMPIVSKYLSGKYFVNIFVSAGVFLSLFSKFKEKEKDAFVFVSLLAFVAGDVRFLSLFLLLFNPFVYICYLFLVFVCYLVSRMLDIRIGFVENGSLFELFKYGNKWIYFILTGLVIVLLTYFAIRLVLTKFDFQKRKFLPRDVKKLVAALGGDRNIDQIKHDKLYVRNPNLINILNIDCEIHENEITLNYDDLQLLKEYY